jgi:hypothetical protein
MQPSFVETMRGTLKDELGHPHRVEFEVSATGEGLGYFRLEGLARAEPWAEDVKANGTLIISPTMRFIRYRVRFPAAGGEWELKGEKRPKLLAPLTSMTTLPIELVDPKGTLKAWGDMTFSLTDLPGFLASWLPFYRGPRKALEAKLVRAP